MSTITQTVTAVTCTGFGERHTDSIVYREAPYGEVRLRWRSTWEGKQPMKESFDFEHTLYCTRHTPFDGSSIPAEFYVTVPQAEAGILLDGVSLLKHRDYLRAAVRRTERSIHLPVLHCPDGADSIQGARGRILVEGQPVGRGQYRLDYGDDIPRTMCV
ncbi:hypothetical protein ACFYY8_41950 [Streptosporangium sp. NPDC001559]|uniref:hypothetical protein n=1 Tax=Streptosporangium sp. NPDC001559 TaxID=3366187 RepID=UPI0036E32BEF